MVQKRTFFDIQCPVFLLIINNLNKNDVSFSRFCPIPDIRFPSSRSNSLGVWAATTKQSHEMSTLYYAGIPVLT